VAPGLTFSTPAHKVSVHTEKFIIPSGVLPAIRAMRDPKKLLRKNVSNSTGVQSCATSVDSGRSLLACGY